MTSAWTVVLAGCPAARDDLSDAQYHGEESLSGSQEHLSRAVRMVEHSEEFNEAMAAAQVLTQLGQWIQDQPPVDDWLADPLTTTLPARYGKYVQDSMTSRMSFTPHDFSVLREAIWMRNISRWQAAENVAQRSALQDEINALDDEIQRRENRSDAPGDAADLQAARERLQQLRGQLDPPWLEKLRSGTADGQGQNAYDDLATAMRLFDWTVRNVQLTPTNWDAELPEDLNTAKESSDSGESTAAKLVPPPGAEMPAWRALLMGRGDAATRARIFALLARQQNIDVVFLGLKRPGDKPPRMWAAATVIGDQLYLFDPELGLPVAGPGGVGVCTLEQLRADPMLLRQFDVGEDLPYHVTDNDLGNLVAMIDATPAYLSQRMMLLERHLAGEQRLVLTVAPSTLAQKLRKMSLPDAALWTAPYSAFEFEQLRRRHPKELADFEQESSVYYSPFPLLKGRMLHFRGELDNRDLNDYGAKYYYMRCRPSEREIDGEADRLEKMVAQMRGIPPEKREEFMVKLPPDARPAFANALRLSDLPIQKQQQYIDQLQSIARTAKAEATYWLGMVALEQEERGVAANYFDERILQADADPRWSSGARYNLARIYEADGHDDKAIALYEADDSPQRHGNLVRAMRLKGAGAHE